MLSTGSLIELKPFRPLNNLRSFPTPPFVPAADVVRFREIRSACNPRQKMRCAVAEILRAGLGGPQAFIDRNAGQHGLRQAVHGFEQRSELSRHIRVMNQ